MNMPLAGVKDKGLALLCLLASSHTHSLSAHCSLPSSASHFLHLGRPPSESNPYSIQLGLRKMEPFLKTLFLSFTFILAGVSPAFHSPATAFSVNSKYEIACTMCDACENPCQPVYSPPPPSPPPPDFSPPPPYQPTTYCPPPPSPKVYPYHSPPPPQSGYVYPPPSSGGGGGGGYYLPPPDGSYYPTTPPPNPLVPYFPFYFYNPPPPGNSADSQFKFSPIVSAFIGLLIWCLCGI